MCLGPLPSHVLHKIRGFSRRCRPCCSCLTCMPVPLPTIDSCSGQGSIFQGKLGNGNGKLKVFALTGTDVALTLT